MLHDNERLRDFSRKLRKVMTPAEAALWSRLRGGRLAGLRFRRQHVIDRCIVDFCCPTNKVVVEVDGGVHLDEAAAKRDRQRQEFLESRDYKVLRFWNTDVHQQLDLVLELIAAACNGEEL